MKNHSVFIGIDDYVLPLMESCLESYRDLIVFSEENVSDIRAKLASVLSKDSKGRVTVCQGDRTDKTELEMLCLEVADEVYVLPGSTLLADDSINLDVVKHISEICDAYGRKGLKCTVVFKEDTAVECFEHSDFSYQIKKTLDFIPIVYADSIARALLSGKVYDNGFLDRETIDAESEKHIDFIILGLGNIGQAIFCQAARQLHFPNFEKARSRITVIGDDKEINTLKGRFRELFEAMGRDDSGSFIDIEIRTLLMNDSVTVESALDGATSSPESIVTVAICTEDASTALRQALSLPRSVYENSIPVWLYKPGSRSLTELIGNNKYYSNIKVFGEYNPAFRLDDSLLVAQRINWVYSFFSKTGLVPKNLPSAKEWEEIWIPAWQELSLSHKWSNLHHADSIPVKLRSLGIDASSEIQLTENQIEQLVKVEHNRWVVETLLAGYRPPTDDERNEMISNRTLKQSFKEKLVHLDLCAFDELLPDANNVDVRDYDKVIVSCIPIILQNEN